MKETRRGPRKFPTSVDLARPNQQTLYHAEGAAELNPILFMNFKRTPQVGFGLVPHTSNRKPENTLLMLLMSALRASWEQTSAGSCRCSQPGHRTVRVRLRRRAPSLLRFDRVNFAVLASRKQETFCLSPVGFFFARGGCAPSSLPRAAPFSGIKRRPASVLVRRTVIVLSSKSTPCHCRP
jgi:hypothetical protein